MIIKRENMKTEERENMRGGPGVTKLVHLDSPENMKNCRLVSEIILPPGAGIGEHEHINETEYYIITQGEGVVCDNGVDTPVKNGDLVVTPHGNSHDITNTGSVDLKFFAVIVTY
jgi:mannose-6-phosphate isomerase-like protein (cupin superfamily)